MARCSSFSNVKDTLLSGTFSFTCILWKDNGGNIQKSSPSEWLPSPASFVAAVVVKGLMTLATWEERAGSKDHSEKEASDLV